MRIRGRRFHRGVLFSIAYRIAFAITHNNDCNTFQYQNQRSRYFLSQVLDTDDEAGLFFVVN